MISDARLLDANAELSADVCIVGSGAAGITIARELRDSGLNVILLESGSFDLDKSLQDLNAGAMTGIDTWKLDEMRFRGCGGTTNLWGGYCRPLLPEDFTARSYVPGGGWPITYDDLVPFYTRACQTVEIGSFQYDVTKLSAASGLPLLPFDPAALESRIYRFSKVNFGVRYRDDLTASTNVNWLLNANLMAIRLTGPGGSVSHLDCGTLQGGRFTVEATQYVLALGGIENARLLLASNKEDAAGVANSSGLVGTFLEHPHYYQAGTFLWEGTPPDLRFYDQHTELDDDGVTQVTIQGALGLPAGLRGQNGLPSFTAMLETGSLPFLSSSPLTPDVVSTLLAPPLEASGVTRLTLRTEQTFTDAGRITLGTDVDAMGMRRVALNWQINDIDRDAILKSFETIGREVGRLGLGRVNLPAKTESAWYPQPGGHHMGTTRMSADPAHGVIDADLRAHDVPNLSIAGASTFASGGDSNPTLTVVALAHRLADRLKAVTS